ncbi:MAG: sulfotransferase [Planctomycetota bacterium]|nr:MAG: sulfotransferase [Planctomycetota bacterium]
MARDREHRGSAGLIRPGGGSAHPLLGADARTIVSLLRRHGVRRGDRAGVLAGALAASVARAPVSLVERAVVARRVRRSGPPEPIFILGHWRSGTTHLYNILSRSPAFTYVPPIATGLPWDCEVLGRLIRPLLERMLPDQRFIDRIPVRPDSPQEDEAALANMQTVSFYHGLYFPRRLREEVMRGVFLDGATPAEIALWERRFMHFLGKMATRRPAARLIVKNPVYTARVAQVRRLVPGARFVHIRRNPYTVFFSMRRFYARLLDAYALAPYSLAGIDGLICDVYERMMDRLAQDAAGLPEGSFVEVEYADLERDPIGTIRAIGAGLGVSAQVEAGVGAFEAYLSGLGDYRKNRHEYDEAGLALVERRLERFIEAGGYERPTSRPTPAAV